MTEQLQPSVGSEILGTTVRKSWSVKRTPSSKINKQNKRAKYEAYLLKKSEKELRRRQKKKHKGKNRKSLLLDPLDETSFEVLPAPENFSIINNTEEVLEYFKNAGRFLSRRSQVQFDLEHIKYLTPDAIALLIARVNDKTFTRGLTVRGNSPNKKDLKKLFDESGFHQHVKSSYQPPPNAKNLLIHQVTHKKVHPEIAKQTCELAVQHSFKNSKKFQPIYKIMIECMANTDNHASPQREGFYDWWLFTYCDPRNKATCFTFLDLGIGIFNSNPVNKFRTDFLNSIENITHMNLTSSDNLMLVPKLFSGDIYTSRTRDKKRGQGLPSIKDLSTNAHIKAFTIITNNVKIRLPNLESQILRNKFNGTILYWELHKN